MSSIDERSLIDKWKDLCPRIAAATRSGISLCPSEFRELTDVDKAFMTSTVAKCWKKSSFMGKCPEEVENWSNIHYPASDLSPGMEKVAYKLTTVFNDIGNSSNGKLKRDLCDVLQSGLSYVSSKLPPRQAGDDPLDPGRAAKAFSILFDLSPARPRSCDEGTRSCDNSGWNSGWSSARSSSAPSFPGSSCRSSSFFPGQRSSWASGAPPVLAH
ncbi:hypothetical protein L204_104175 [Cryptococcus depauperatus]|nr:hypothetical protein L204_05004 [Cryptococcus depauperatus CBS 7855]